jgi:hypothetical protein
MPYTHWVYQGEFDPHESNALNSVASFSSIPTTLLDYRVLQEVDHIAIHLVWRGSAFHTDSSSLASVQDSAISGDGVVFIHLYNEGKLNEKPVAQVVSRPARGVLPPGNWLPGIIEDSYTLPLPDDLPPGKYVIAIGMFDAQTGERYTISLDELKIDDNRLFIGEIIIEE